MPDSPTLPGSDPDLDLVHRVRNGETELFELLMRRHNQRLFRVARVFATNANEAEDIMQDAYVRAFTALDRFEARARFSTWLTQIAINEGLARCRRRRANSYDAVEHLMDTSHSPEDLASSAEVRRLLESAIGRLDEPFRLVFVLRAVEQLSVREVSECLDVEEATVKTRYLRARATLKGVLAQHAEAIAPGLYDFQLQRCDRVVARVMQQLPQ
jgi:RNA polymerase sigma-70 factor (ECF subfamily)